MNRETSDSDSSCDGNSEKEYSKKRKIDFSDTDETALASAAEHIEKQLHRKSQSYDQKRFNCNVCGKKFSTTKQLKRHGKQHLSDITCELCGQTFSRLDSARRHRKTIHKIHTPNKTRDSKKKNVLCDLCPKNFKSAKRLRTHVRYAHSGIDHAFSCRHCSDTFNNYEGLFNHVSQVHPLTQVGGRVANNQRETDITSTDVPFRNDAPDETLNTQKPSDNGDSNQNITDQSIHVPREVNDESAIQNNVQNRTILPRNEERYDLLAFFANVRTQIRTYIQSRVYNVGGIKWNACVQVELERQDGIDDVRTTTPFFRSRTYISLTNEDFSEHNLNEALQKMNASLEKFMREGSGFYVKRILKLEIHTVIYRPISASTYIPLPPSLSRRRCLLNIENTDNKCFVWCILASLHPSDCEPQNAFQYIPFQHELDLTNIQYPVTLQQIDTFEKRNVNISVNVFTHDEGATTPLKITCHSHRLHHVNLLWIKDGDLSHYCLIRDLNTFLSHGKSTNRRVYYCSYCLNEFGTEELLHNHTPYCSTHGAQKAKLPQKGHDDVLTFQSFEKEMRVPFTIYADFETLNSTIDGCAPNPNHSSTTQVNKLQVCSFGYKVVCSDDRYTKKTVIYRGPDASTKLIECLLKEQKEIESILSVIQPMVITAEDSDRISRTTHCCICRKEFSLYDKTHNRPVRHHDHLTGKFINLAHNTCNLKCQQAKYTCVIFHNLKNFDAHIVCQSAGLFKQQEIKCIAQTSERYTSFSIGNLRFIDSLQFLPASLETLVDNLAQDGHNAFPNFVQEFPLDKSYLLLRKGVYPYDFMDSEQKFNLKDIPPIESFYSSLKREHISMDDYAHAQHVFKTFNLKDLGDYHDLYLKTDVILLCDVFEAFRNVCMKQFGLDCCHFYGSPGLSWASCLKMTGVRLELMTDIDHVLFVEQGIRGGISQISNRHKTANNPLVDNYDTTLPTSYLLYLDMNNLYGWAMTQSLPVSNFRFLNSNQIEELDVMTIAQDAGVGYIVEVSLRYPENLHDAHNDYPLAPERKLIDSQKLSPYAQHLWKKIHGKEDSDEFPQRVAVQKLMTTLDDKSHYILHYRNLQLYLELGLEIIEIHRVLEFQQKPWMKRYIDFNTEQRKKAKSVFEKNFYKLMNVSVFGKTMENVRKYKSIQLVHTEKKLRKLSTKPTYKTSKIFNKDLIAVEQYRNRVTLNKPSYSGMCILDLSKWIMYDFFYKYLKSTFNNRVQLQMTDTDSLLLFIETNDVYKDMSLKMDLFDTSDYPKEHFLYSDKNKKALGKMKDETVGRPISEFIGLRSKLYSFVCDGKEEKKAKGVSRSTVQHDVRFEHYKNVLFDETQQKTTMTSIKSHNHELFSEVLTKTGLSSFDDKRYLINAVESYAYGHYKIEKERNSNDVSDVDNTVNVSKESRTFQFGDFTVTRI